MNHFRRRSQPRVFWVRIRLPSRYWTNWLAVGLLVSWALAYVAIGLPVAAYWYRSLEDLPGSAYAVACAVATIGPVYWSIIAFRWRRTQIRGPNSLRQQRLESLCHRPEFNQRYPHRNLELAFRSEKTSGRHMRKLLSRFLPGDVCIITSPGVGRSSPERRDLAFEPIDLEAEEETEALAEAGYDPAVGDGGNTDEAGATEKSLPFWKVDVDGWLDWIGLIVLLFIMIRTGVRNPVLLCVMTALLGIRFYGRLVYERRFWMVPGGILFREARAWRRGLRIGSILRADSALVIDSVHIQSYTLHEGRVLRLPCAGPPLLVAWLSTARPPTPSEVAEFFGVKQS